MWVLKTETEDQGVLDNAPGFFNGIAAGDTIFYEDNREQGYIFKGLATSGGHSSTKVRINDPGSVPEVWEKLTALCDYVEGYAPRTFSLDLEPHTSYAPLEKIFARSRK